MNSILMTMFDVGFKSSAQSRSSYFFLLAVSASDPTEMFNLLPDEQIAIVTNTESSYIWKYVHVYPWKPWIPMWEHTQMKFLTLN